MRPALLALLLAAACTHSVNVKSEDPTAQLIVSGTDLGVPPAGGAKVDVPFGIDPVPYEVHGTDGGVTLGEIPRTEPVWWVIALGAAGCLCCAPSATAGGFFLANFGSLASAPFVFALTGDVGLFTKSFNYPSWFTVPVTTACCAVGMSPLSAAFFAEVPPDDVTLPRPAPRAPDPATPSVPPVAMRY